MRADDVALARICMGLQRRLVGRLQLRLTERQSWLEGMSAGCKSALAEAGFRPRMQDRFAWLLALVALSLADDDAIAEGHGFAPYFHVIPDRAGSAHEARMCLEHLLSTPVEIGGQSRRVGELVHLAIETFPAKRRDILSSLGKYGIRIVPPRSASASPEAGQWGIAIANGHPGLDTLFKGSRWGSAVGATGGWRKPLLDLPGARRAPHAAYFGGKVAAAVVLPLALICSAAPPAWPSSGRREGAGDPKGNSAQAREGAEP